MLIGRFARRSGVSVGALRHYAEVGLLTPARVDPQTGYRYYREDQLPVARRIAVLRQLDVPLRVLRSVHDVPPAQLRDRLAGYRAEIEATIWRLQRQSHRLAHVIDIEEAAMPTPTFTLDPDDERRLAGSLFNRVWDLLEKTDRDTTDEDAMLHAAHASRHHWGVVGEPVRWARGEWQISRVYAVLGRAEPALHHGRRYLQLAEQHELGPFDFGYAHEAIARAHRLAGQPADAASHLDLARAAAGKVTDAEDRDLLQQDLDQLADPAPPPAPADR
ncbi:MAG TPA: MerR family transcriptional regulator [Mycobacteriales bacterium]|nr:MerR family transcriptional regulator [Mycobacteriales bacterium]